MMLGLMITAKRETRILKNTEEKQEESPIFKKKAAKSFQLVSGFCYLSIKLTY
jgi:hypothetical protein